MNYIYHIYAKDDPTTLYIGQSSANDSDYSRALDHFSGVWKRGKNGSAYENPKFQAFMLKHSLNEIIIEIYDDKYFGVPQKDFERFAAKWFPTYNQTLEIRQQRREETSQDFQLKNKTNYSDSERLNIAEIMHIYYYSIQLGYTVLAMSMGGQNYATISTEGNILNREMSPAQMRTVIERGSTQAFQQLQQVFTNKLTAELDMKDRWGKLSELLALAYLNLLKPTMGMKEPGTRINWVLDRWFANHIEKIINEMQDVMAHTQDGFRIQWPKDHSRYVKMKTTNGNIKSLIDLFRITLNNNKKRLEEAIALDRSNKNFKDRKLLKNQYSNFINLIKELLAQKIEIGIGIANFIQIKPLSQTVKLIAVEGGIRNGKVITENTQVQTTLKRMSYFFFADCANLVKEEVQNQVGSTVEDIASSNKFRRSIELDEDKFVSYKILSVTTFYNKIWEIYKSYGITAKIISQAVWPDFCRGMLTVYTKNRGTITGGQLELNSIDGVFLGGLGETLIEDRIIIPAYQFSSNTYDEIHSYNTMNIEDLTIY